MSFLTDLGGSGILDIAGGLIGNEASAREAAKNRRFQKNMANTAVQRRVKDLEAAGLNPMLAFMGGGHGAMQAATPSGSMAHQENPFKGVTSAFQQRELQKAQIASLDVQNTRTLADAKAADAQARKATAEAALIESTSGATALSASLNVDKLRQDLELLGQQIAKATQDAIKAGQEVDQNRRIMPLLIKARVAETAAIEAGIGEKEVRSNVLKAVEKVGSKRTAEKVKEMWRDTSNLIDDKWRNFRHSAREAWEKDKKFYSEKFRSSINPNVMQPGR